MNAVPASNFLVEFAQYSDGGRKPVTLGKGARTTIDGQEEFRERELAEAYNRGLADGRNSIETELQAAVRQQELASAAARENDRRAWMESEGAAIREAIESSFEEIERRIAEPAARVLTEMLEQHAQSKAVEELRVAVRKLLRDGAISIEGTAPPDLIALLLDKERFPEISTAQIEPGESEIRFRIGETLLETNITAWAMALRKKLP